MGSDVELLMRNPTMDLASLAIHKGDASHQSPSINPRSNMNIIVCRKGGRGSRNFREKSISKSLAFSLDGELGDIPIISIDTRALRESFPTTGVY